MPRRPRLVIADVPLHIIQRGNNRQPCFVTEPDYLVYLDLLQRAALASDCRVHAYALMTNHTHILATPATATGPGAMMKSVGERYVKYFNTRHGRIGTLWNGRFKSCLIHDESYLLVCYRYIELNPVRAGMVHDALQYRWSSYRANAYGGADSVITPHPLFESLAVNAEDRRAAYRALVSEGVPASAARALRDATNHNYACGSDAFIGSIETALGMPAERKWRPIHPLRD